MTPSQLCREKIESALKRGLPDIGALSALAADFDEHCRKLNGRLEQLQSVLDSGDERQALLMAEEYPPVMDEAQALSFPKLGQWREMCSANHLAIPPELRTSVVQQLNVIYAKGITSSHSIYKEFRTAVLERDDARALVLARTIEKLNPADVNAKSERERIEKKVFNSYVTILGESIQSADVMRILRSLAATEALGLPDRESDSSQVQEAREIRRKHDARQAEGKIVEYLSEMASAGKSGHWVRVRELIARIEGLAVEHKLILPPDQIAAIADGRSLFTEKQNAAIKSAEFKEALKNLLTHAEAVESKTQAKGGSTASELHALLSELSRHWQTVEGFSMKVDHEVIEKVSRLVEILRSEIARLQKRRVATVSASVALAVVVVSVTGWFLLGLFRAKESAALIRTEIAARHCTAAARLASEAESKGLPRFSSELVGAIESAAVFQKSVETSVKLADSHLEEFEVLAERDKFGGGIPADVSDRFARLDKEITSLPGEYQTTFKTRMEKCRESLESWLASQGESNTAKLTELLDAFECKNKPLLEKDQSIVEFRTVLASASMAADAWRPLAESRLPALKIPADLASRVEITRSKLETLKSGLTQCDEALDGMARATNVKEYQEALAKLGASEMIFLSDVRAARLAQPAQPGIEEFMARLLFPDDPSAWIACKNGGEAMDLHPQTLLPREDAAYDKLLNDPYSDKIYQASITGSPDRIIYTQGAPLSSDPGADGRLDYSGKVFDPRYDGNSIKFSLRSFSSESHENSTRAKFAGDKRLSTFSTVYSAMSPKSFMANNGNIVHSVWELIDRATATNEKSPVYMAFVAQQIQDLVSVRPYAWGVHFTPGAKAFLTDVKDKLGGERIVSGSWMFPETSERAANKLGDIFSKTTSFQKEASFNRAVTVAVVNSGLDFAGYVDFAGRPVLSDKISPPDALFGLNGTINENAPARLFDRESDGQSYRTVGTPIPLTPLFRFTGERKEVLKKAMKAAGLESLSSITLPPLFSGLDLKKPL